VETILIFRIGGLGDTVVALPCFHQIARSFPNSRRVVITDLPASQKTAPVESILGKSGLIDEVICFPPPPRKIHDILKLRSQIRKTGSRMLIYVADRNLRSTLRDLCFFRLCGIERVIGAPLGRDLRVTRIDSKTGFTENEATRLARCLAPLETIDSGDPAFRDLCLNPDEIAIADGTLMPLGGNNFVAINVGGKSQCKDWGNNNWAALFQFMAPRYSTLGLVFVGSDDEFERSAGLAAIWPGPTLNLCGCLAPRESAAAMRRAVVFLGHDSGPMHLAAAVGVPCVGIFGDCNMPKCWHPMGQGHRIVHNMRGVRENTPEEVYAAVCSTIEEALAQAQGRKLELFQENFLEALGGCRLGAPIRAITD
jgi:heptosyltransferase III